MKAKIKQMFGEDILKRSAVNLPNGVRHINKFMKKKPIKAAIEIGTFRGVTSCIMSKNRSSVNREHRTYV